MPDTRTTTNRQFAQMMRIAEEIGCQLKPAAKDRRLLRGLCPFHPAENLENALTLIVNTKNCRWWCESCDSAGNPAAFAAMTWQVTAEDARQLLLTTEKPTMDRPPYPDLSIFESDKIHRPQNTALLTRAMIYYRRQLKLHYPPMEYLARLHVPPDDAAKAGIGFAPGHGLMDFLIQRGITHEEIGLSPLFTESYSQTVDILNGRITIADLDSAGAARYITSVASQHRIRDYQLQPSPPRTFSIPGRKPYLLNTRALKNRDWTIITDDVRLYIIAASLKLPVLLHTQRRTNTQDLTRSAGITAEQLNDRKIRQVTLALHDYERRDRTISALKELNPEINTRYLNQHQILDYIRPETRRPEQLTPEAVNRSVNGRRAPEDTPAPQASEQTLTSH